MKYFMVLFLLFSGCASVSQYGQGCRDGVNTLLTSANYWGGRGFVDDECNTLEKDRNRANSPKEVRRDSQGKAY